MNFSLLKKTVFIVLLIGFINTSFGQNILLSKNARASIITCDTGNETYSLFGHTAIRITDVENNLDVVYNYGAFDFATPNFVVKFTKGDLLYFAVAHSFSDFMNEYAYEQRSVFEQELIVPLALKQKLLDHLNTAMASEERYYTYKFIDKNCTSMVVNLLNKTLGSNVVVKKTDTDKTYRTILYPYFEHSFYEKLGTSIIFGKKVDQLGTSLFLPFELQKSLKVIPFENHPLCKESKTLLEYKKQSPNSWWDNYYTFAGLLLFIAVFNQKSIDLIYLLTMGTLGVFFGLVGFYSFHQELSYNYNILLFNPALLLLLYFQYTKNKQWIINLCLFNILLLLVYLVMMLNKIHLLIVLPLIITNGVLLIKLAIQNKKLIPIII